MIPNGPRCFRPGEPLLSAMQYDWASPVAQTLKNLPVMWETWVRSLGWEDSMEEGMITHCSTLAWRIPMDRGAWRATVHRVTKSRTGLCDEAHLADNSIDCSLQQGVTGSILCPPTGVINRSRRY